MSRSSVRSPLPPTRARYALLFFLGSLAFVLYLDRVCIGKAATSMESELGITDAAMSFVFGAFTIAYGLFEVPTGNWGDRFGSRRVLTRIVVWWSVFTVLTGLVPAFSWEIGRWPGAAGTILAIDSFVALLIIRFLFGAGEAGALPNTARVVARWFPASERPLAQGTVLTCMLLGGTISPIAAGYIIEWSGWRWAFAIFGCVGVVWAIAFWWWYRDDPAEHPGVNSAELELIESSAQLKAAGGQGHPPIPWSFVLASANVWLLGSIISCAAFAAYFYTYWFPRYLEDGRNVAQEDSKWYAGLVMAGGAAGALLGSLMGAWVDRLPWNARWKRCWTGFTLLAAAALCLSCSVRCESPLWASIWVMLAFGFAQAQQATWWTVVADISGKHLGAMFGLLNSMGVPGAFSAQILTGLFVEHRKTQGFTGRGAWDPIYSYYVMILVLGAVLWLFVDATRSAVEFDEETKTGLAEGRLTLTDQAGAVTAEAAPAG